jgi:hypothetical protein
MRACTSGPFYNTTQRGAWRMVPGRVTMWGRACLFAITAAVEAE